MSRPTATSMTGTITAISQAIPGSTRSARIIPPIPVTGAWTSMFREKKISICTCCTSFVERVMREGVPNSASSRGEKEFTRRKTAWRRSLPTRIAERAAKKFAATSAMMFPSEITSMIRPSSQITGTSAFATPSSMMSALRVGR